MPVTSKTFNAQLALLVSEPPSGPQWIHELKLDGYRIGIILAAGKVRLMSRRGTEWTSEFPRTTSSGPTASSSISIPESTSPGPE